MLCLLLPSWCRPLSSYHHHLDINMTKYRHISFTPTLQANRVRIAVHGIDKPLITGYLGYVTLTFSNLMHTHIILAPLAWYPNDRMSFWHTSQADGVKIVVTSRVQWNGETSCVVWLQLRFFFPSTFHYQPCQQTNVWPFGEFYGSACSISMPLLMGSVPACSKLMYFVCYKRFSRLYLNEERHASEEEYSCTSCLEYSKPIKCKLENIKIYLYHVGDTKYMVQTGISAALHDAAPRSSSGVVHDAYAPPL